VTKENGMPGPIRRLVYVLASVAVLSPALMVVAATAASARGTWSAPSDIDGSRTFESVSCPSATFCIAVDSTGYASNYNGSSWSSLSDIDEGESQFLQQVSCPSAKFCVAVDETGEALTYNGSSWSSPSVISPLPSVSCPSASFCAAVGDEGNALTYNGSSWSSPSDVDGSNGFESVSCPSASFCVAVDYEGNALTYNGSSWSSPSDVDGSNTLTSVSCPSASFCVAVDYEGNALTYNGSSWLSPSDIDGSTYLNSVSCPSTSFCVAVDHEGNALTYNGSSWSSPSDIDGSNILSSVSCPSAGFCVAVDGDGNALTYTSTKTAGSCASTSGTPAFDLTLSPGTPPQNGATGTGWKPNTKVDLYLDTAQGAVEVGSAITGSSGAFTLNQGSTTSSGLAPLQPLINLDRRNTPEEFDVDEAYPLEAIGSCGDAAIISTVNDHLLTVNPHKKVIEFESSSHVTNAGCTAGGSAIPTATSPPDVMSPTELPLQTQSRWIVDQSGQRVKLASVSWYGAEEADFVPGGLQCQSIATIAGEIAEMGFNSVRLPWSNAMFEEDPSTCSGSDLAESDAGARDPCIPPEVIAANPALVGSTALDIYQDVVNALAADHIMVILDDHSTDATWEPAQFNGVWWGGQIWDEGNLGYGATNWKARTDIWITDWIGMVTLFTNQPYVIGADLRNEPNGCEDFQCDPGAPGPGAGQGGDAYGQKLIWSSGDSPSINNWKSTAQWAAPQVLAADPDMGLIMVEGIGYSNDLTGVYKNPILLPRSPCPNDSALGQCGHIVYSPHDYSQDVFDAAPNPLTSYGSMDKAGLFSTLGNAWGFILTQDKTYTAPVWVGEFGVGQTADNNFFKNFTAYLQNADIDWSYWAVNGTEADGGVAAGWNERSVDSISARVYFDEESFGILNPSWNKVTHITKQAGLLPRLQELICPTQGPNLTKGCNVSAGLPGVEDCNDDAGAVALHPTEIAFACATGDDYVTPITWSSWTRTAASGTGTFHLDLCEPDCAAGPYKLYQVAVSLTDPGDYLGHLVYQKITLGPLQRGEQIPEIKDLNEVPQGVGVGWGAA
jgi:hypothetical protein